jgi:hypothetical protein
MTEYWVEQCTRYWGVSLTGKYAHYCPEWDFLPIDETCKEFEHCSCDHKAIAEENKLEDYLGEV